MFISAAEERILQEVRKVHPKSISLYNLATKAECLRSEAREVLADLKIMDFIKRDAKNEIYLGPKGKEYFGLKEANDIKDVA